MFDESKLSDDLNEKEISEIITCSSHHSLPRNIINVHGMRRANSFKEWRRTKLDISALNAEVRLNTFSDERSKELEKKHNSRLNEIKQKEINEDTEKIINYKNHNKQKFLEKLFFSSNQQAVTQNLPYNDDYLSKNVAHEKCYEKIMQKERS